MLIIRGLVLSSALRDLLHYQVSIQSGTPKYMMLNKLVSFLCTSVSFDQHLTFTKLKIEDGTIVSIGITYYYKNTNEIPGERSRENLISSHVKITCYLHM